MEVQPSSTDTETGDQILVIREEVQPSLTYNLEIITDTETGEQILVIREFEHYFTPIHSDGSNENIKYINSLLGYLKHDWEKFKKLIHDQAKVEENIFLFQREIDMMSADLLSFLTKFKITINPLRRFITVIFKDDQLMIGNCSISALSNGVFSQILYSINRDDIDISGLINCINKLSETNIIFDNSTYIFFLFLLEKFPNYISSYLNYLWKKIKKAGKLIEPCNDYGLFIFTFLLWFCIKYMFEQTYVISMCSSLTPGGVPIYPLNIQNLKKDNNILNRGSRILFDYNKWYQLINKTTDLNEMFEKLLQQYRQHCIGKPEYNDISPKFQSTLNIIFILPLNWLFQQYSQRYKLRYVKFTTSDSRGIWSFINFNRKYLLGNKKALIQRFNTIFRKLFRIGIDRVFGTFSVGNNEIFYESLRLLENFKYNIKEEKTKKYDTTRPHIIKFIFYINNSDGEIDKIVITDSNGRDNILLNKQQSNIFLEHFKFLQITLLISNAITITDKHEKYKKLRISKKKNILEDLEDDNIRLIRQQAYEMNKPNNLLYCDNDEEHKTPFERIKSMGERESTLEHKTPFEGIKSMGERESTLYDMSKGMSVGGSKKKCKKYSKKKHSKKRKRKTLKYNRK